MQELIFLKMLQAYMLDVMVQVFESEGPCLRLT